MLKADSKYTFSRKTILKTSYIFEEKQGDDFPFSIYKNVPYCKACKTSLPELKGQIYVVFREMSKMAFAQFDKYKFCLSLTNGSMPIGINPERTIDGCHIAYGNDRCLQGRNDCFLLRFSPDWTQLTIFIFNKQGNNELKLYNRLKAGEAIEVKE